MMRQSKTLSFFETFKQYVTYGKQASCPVHMQNIFHVNRVQWFHHRLREAPTEENPLKALAQTVQVFYLSGKI